eukprot:scaffold7328_cov314-Pinguiococcus_pyrenoidosus.AAC.2
MDSYCAPGVILSPHDAHRTNEVPSNQGALHTRYAADDPSFTDAGLSPLAPHVFQDQTVGARKLLNRRAAVAEVEVVVEKLIRHAFCGAACRLQGHFASLGQREGKEVDAHGSNRSQSPRPEGSLGRPASVVWSFPLHPHGAQRGKNHHMLRNMHPHFVRNALVMQRKSVRGRKRQRAQHPELVLLASISRGTVCRIDGCPAWFP